MEAGLAIASEGQQAFSGEAVRGGEGQLPLRPLRMRAKGGSRPQMGQDRACARRV